jgi:lactate dehydrogenase-like 2-hydroxyacid dehydrogenase
MIDPTARRGALRRDVTLHGARAARSNPCVCDRPQVLDPGNAFLMPHLAAETIEASTAGGMLALDNIDAVLAGRPAPSLVIV